MNKRRRRTSFCVMVVAPGMPVGCATNKPEMAWVRTDGRRIGDDADLLKQGHTDIAVCNANLDAGVVDQGGRDCMAKKGYALVRKDTLSCAKTRRSRHEQDTRHQPLSVLRHLLRLIGKRGVLLKILGFHGCIAETA